MAVTAEKTRTVRGAGSVLTFFALKRPAEKSAELTPTPKGPIASTRAIKRTNFSRFFAKRGLASSGKRV